MDTEIRTLEQIYIDEYLSSKHLTRADLKTLPEAEAKHLMTEAVTYACAKLAEIEERARVMDSITGTMRGH